MHNTKVLELEIDWFHQVKNSKVVIDEFEVTEDVYKSLSEIPRYLDGDRLRYIPWVFEDGYHIVLKGYENGVTIKKKTV